MKTLISIPFTGLGLYNGFRGNRWLRNRIAIFEKFVIPSLLAQTDQDFSVWVAWRREERDNKYVQALYTRMQSLPWPVVFTYTGVPFWDDKYDDTTARLRLIETLHGAMHHLLDFIPDCTNVCWILQPSDDCYHKEAVASIKKAFKETDAQAVTFTKGYICNYNTLEVLEYNPKTNPPFFAINFPREKFIDPGLHLAYTGPYKSHEYVGEALKLARFEGRGFLVGTHGENISTHFNHPYGGDTVPKEILDEFGLHGVTPLQLPISFRKWLMRRLPYQWQRKLRYWFGELFAAKLYNWIRN